MIVPPSIETERLKIRRHVPEDFEPMRSNFCDEEVTRLLDMTAEQKTEEATCAPYGSDTPPARVPMKIQASGKA
jgi:hypothetical protein